MTASPAICRTPKHARAWPPRDPLLRIMRAYLDRLPNRDIAIDLDAMTVTRI
ncbi:hypothetical protein QWZ10_24430 [Paracoccus cavernae]|uniref:Transposase n=1 Tax=Paracoccus cavernae TaxID=1571207 RepID=A0ABT8DCJ3_9RHOB|nr:hypothetical protein [Paracoccus cavernae]